MTIDSFLLATCFADVNYFLLLPVAVLELFALANEMAAACTAFIRGYDKLARLCVQKNVSRFKLIPKMHICRHFAEDIVRFKYNIRYHHCYKDEDCVGIMKKLACKVHAGSLMEYRIICRWLLRVSCWVPGTGS